MTRESFAATRQCEASRASVRCATATLVAQFFGCMRSTPLITVSPTSWCECPNSTTSTPPTSRATRPATFSLGTCVVIVS